MTEPGWTYRELMDYLVENPATGWEDELDRRYRRLSRMHAAYRRRHR